MFRLWFLANQRQRVYVNIAVVNNVAGKRFTTLYVPNQTDFEYGGTFFQCKYSVSVSCLISIARNPSRAQGSNGLECLHLWFIQ